MITENVKKHLINIPQNVLLVAAIKKRTAVEVREAAQAGIRAIGENYLQEAKNIKQELSDLNLKWHFIGHLQKNKARKAVELFDMVETVDSIKLAEQLDRLCQDAGKSMDILLEINIAEEKQKSGLLPVQIENTVKEISKASNLNLKGFMTMGPWVNDPEQLRPWFAKAAHIFANYRSEQISELSMGMSDSWKIAVQEGATIVRIGTALFGERI